MIDHPIHNNIFTGEEAIILRGAYRMALHLVADRPAFFSGMAPDDVRRRLVTKIIADATAGQFDPIQLSNAAVRSVERIIRGKGGIGLARTADD